MLKTAFLLSFLLTTLSLFAQKTVFPVRIDGKWGFINLRGKVVVPAKYDAIADWDMPWHGLRSSGNSHFRLVSVGDKCGLLNIIKKEVLPPVFDRIYVLSKDLFAVKRDSFFGVVNLSGEVVFDATGYDDVSLSEGNFQALNDVFFIKKDYLWGVAAKNKEWKIEPQYIDIQGHRSFNALFSVRKSTKELWGLIDQTNKLILPFDYPQIKVYHQDCFVVGSDENWKAIDRNRATIIEGGWNNFYPLNGHLLTVQKIFDTKNSQITGLYHYKKKEIIREGSSINGYRRLDENFILENVWGTLMLIDSNGVSHSIKSMKFKEVEKTRSPYYRVALSQKNYGKAVFWGLFKPGLDSLSIPLVYSDIGDFQDSVSIVKLDKKYGLLNLALKEVIPPLYNTLYLEENLAKATTDSSLVVFELGGNGEVLRADEFPGAEMINVEVSDSLVEPINVRRRRYIKEEIATIGWGDNDFTSDGCWFWQKDDKNSLYTLLYKDTLSKQVTRYIGPMVRFFWHIPKAGIALVFSDTSLVSNEFAPFMGNNKRLCRMAIFNYEEKRFVTDFNLLGLRREDFDNQNTYAAFIDDKGKMGLINAFGKQVQTTDGQSFRCTFIDDFVEGRARFCDQGKLEKAINENSRTAWDAAPLDDIFGLTQYPKQEYIKPITLSIESEGKWGFVQYDGTITVEPRLDYAQNYSKESAVCRKDGKWGVLNLKGDTTVGFHYRWVTTFGNYWRVFLKEPNEFLFNSNGVLIKDTANIAITEVIPKKSSKIVPDSLRGYLTKYKLEPLPNGYWRSKVSNQVGLIAPSGKEIFKPIYTDVLPLGQDFFKAKISSSNAWQWIDAKGKIKSNNRFESMSSFSEKHALVRSYGRPALLSDSGALMTLKSGDEGLFYSEGFAGIDTLGRQDPSVKKEVKMRYCFYNTQGINEFGRFFFEIKKFERGISLVKVGNFWGAINRFGIYIIPPKYGKIELQEQGIAVKIPTLMGLVSRYGRVLLQAEYDRIELISGGYFRVEKGDKVGYIKEDGTWIWRLQ
jgi:WG containing repeat